MMPPTGESICVIVVDLHKKNNMFVLWRDVKEKQENVDEIGNALPEFNKYSKTNLVLNGNS